MRETLDVDPWSLQTDTQDTPHWKEEAGSGFIKASGCDREEQQSCRPPYVTGISGVTKRHPECGRPGHLEAVSLALPVTPHPSAFRIPMRWVF